MENTSCLLCGAQSTFCYYNQHKHKSFRSPFHKVEDDRIWTKWKQNCGMSLCSVLSLPSTELFTSAFTNGSYCTLCADLVLDVEFTLAQIKVLEKRVGVIRMQVEDNLENHLKMLQLERKNLGDLRSPHRPSRHSCNKFRVVRRIIEELQQRTRTVTSNSDGGAGVKLENGVFIIEKKHSPRTVDTPLIQKKRCGSEVTSNNTQKKPSAERFRTGTLLQEQGPYGEQPQKEVHLSDDDDYVVEVTEWILPDDHDGSPDEKNNPQIIPIPKISSKPMTAVRKRIRIKKNKKTGRPIFRKIYDASKTYPCSKCGHVCLSQSGLLLHTRSLHPGTTFNCTACYKSFKSFLSLDAHMKAEHNQKYSVYCRRCQKGCYSEEELTEHEKCHNSNTPFQCSICEAIFTNSLDLQAHVREHENPFKCTLCNKCYASDNGLQKHMKYHQKNYRCETCGVGFLNIGSLKEHQELHTNPGRRFQCEMCALSYRDSRGLKRHQKRIHTGERPFVCFVCKKAFYSSQELKKHEETHSGIQPYACSICGKAFGVRQNLKQHELIHDTTKPKKKRKPRSKPLNCQITEIRLVIPKAEPSRQDAQLELLAAISNLATEEL